MIKIHYLKVFELHLLSIHLLILPSKLWFILKIALWRHYRHGSYQLVINSFNHDILFVSMKSKIFTGNHA